MSHWQVVKGNSSFTTWYTSYLYISIIISYWFQTMQWSSFIVANHEVLEFTVIKLYNEMRMDTYLKEVCFWDSRGPGTFGGRLTYRFETRLGVFGRCNVESRTKIAIKPPFFVSESHFRLWIAATVFLTWRNKTKNANVFNNKTINFGLFLSSTEMHMMSTNV